MLIILHRNQTRSAVRRPASFEVVYIPLSTKGGVQDYITSVKLVFPGICERVRLVFTVEPGESTRRGI